MKDIKNDPVVKALLESIEKGSPSGPLDIFGEMLKAMPNDELGCFFYALGHQMAVYNDAVIKRLIESGVCDENSEEVDCLFSSYKIMVHSMFRLIEKLPPPQVTQ
jgi:hypothetical protein